jgi:hypothetical protein
MSINQWWSILLGTLSYYSSVSLGLKCLYEGHNLVLVVGWVGWLLKIEGVFFPPAILSIFPFPSSSTLVPLSSLSHFYLYPASTYYVHSYAVNRKGTEVHYTKRNIKVKQEKKKLRTWKLRKNIRKWDTYQAKFSSSSIS